MKKGQIRRVWTPEQKAEIVSKHLNDHISVRTLETDNPIIEALNGWIKEELYLNFELSTADNVLLLLDKYVHYFNSRRPAAALGYKSPVQYRTEPSF